jgi:anaerobic selenocysteine-containing dehydrogenase
MQAAMLAKCGLSKLKYQLEILEMRMEENSRRSFFKKAAAAGVVAAAGCTSTLVAASVKNSDPGARYAADIALQEKAVKENHLVVMTDEEKQQRLNELFNCHYQEIA